MYPTNVLTLDDLAGNTELNWAEIKEAVKESPLLFEPLLFKLHFKRKKQLSDNQRENILAFLHHAYDVTKDVRYYNEFLWFHKASAKNDALKQKSEAVFNRNLNAKQQHCHPFDLSEIAYLKNGAEKSTDLSLLQGVKIGLIGFPVFFGTICKTLNRYGAQVTQFFIPRHPSKLVSKLLKQKMLVRMASLASGNSFSYKTLDHPSDSPEIYSRLKEQQFKIGFHKLNFIIRENIFGAFDMGLINDHWAALPYLRGKSTLAYTLLLGLPVIVTTHLIEKGVDTGKIIKLYQYDVRGAKKIKDVRKLVKKHLASRVVDSLATVLSPGFRFTENDVAKGRTYYEMHPALFSFIEEKILKTA